MARIERKTKRYPNDLTDEEWARIAPLLPKPAKRGCDGAKKTDGRKRSVDPRCDPQALAVGQAVPVS